MPQNETRNPIAAIVVTYNRLELLQQCVKALRAQTAACDILIVDNASTDGTAQWLASKPELNYRNTGSNLGGAGGFNFGMRWAVEAGYEYVWVMDDDTLPKPDALQKLLEADSVLEGNYGWAFQRCPVDGRQRVQNEPAKAEEELLRVQSAAEIRLGAGGAGHIRIPVPPGRNHPPLWASNKRIFPMGRRHRIYPPYCRAGRASQLHSGTEPGSSCYKKQCRLQCGAG